MKMLSSLRKLGLKDYAYALVVVFTGVLVTNIVLFYFYKCLGNPLPPLSAYLYLLFQGYDYSLGFLQFNYSEIVVIVFAISCGVAFSVTMFKKKPAANTDNRKPSERPNKIMILSLVLLFSIMIIGRRYLVLLHPAGFDAPNYMAEIQSLQYFGINQNTFFFLSCSALFYPLTFAGMQAEDIVKIIPILLTMFTMVVVYKLTKESHFGNMGIPYIAAILVPLSLTVIRQSADLYTSLLTYSVILVSFMLLLRLIINGDRASLIILSILLPYMMLFYGIGWLLFAVSTLIFLILNYIQNRNGRIAKRTATAFLSSLFFIAIGFIYRPFGIDRRIASLIKSYMSFDLNNWATFLLTETEQSLLVVLSIVGLFVLVKLSRANQDEHTQLSAKLIISYSFTISVVFLFTSTYRVLLYLPFPVLASIGLTAIMRKAERKRNPTPNSVNHGTEINHHTAATSLIVAALLISLLLSNALYYEDHTTEVTGYPPGGAADCLVWVGNNFGSNSLIIVNTFDSEVNWIPAIIPPRIYRGDSIYLGTIFEFLEGKPSQLAGYPLHDPSFFSSFFNDFLVGNLHVFVIDGFKYKVDDSEIGALLLLYSNGDYTVYTLEQP